MKKILMALLLNTLIVFPILVKAETYEQSKTISNSYMDRTNFKNSYNKYIFIQDNKLGDMITKEEFEVTRYNKNKEYKNISYSYLWDSRPFWSKSKNGENYISISNGYNSYDKNDEANTKNIKTKVTEYTKSKVTVLGSGTYTDPWLFAPEYKVYIKVNDFSKGYITDKTNKTIKKEFVEYYLTSNSSPEYIYINSIGSNKYIGSTCGYILNGIDGNKDITNGDGPYLFLSNVTRDIECTINFGEKPSEIILSQEHAECGKSSPEKLYFTTTTGWFSDEYGNLSINSLEQKPCRIGYTFNGYGNSSSLNNACSSTKVIDENGKLSYSKNILESLTNKQTLYPCYVANVYTVSYDVNGGNALPQNSKEVTFDEQYGPLQTPTRTGYIFAGWYTEKENGSRILTNTKVSNPSDHTIYAQWTPITYSISYDAAGGTLGEKAPTTNLKYDEVVEISYPTRQGYDFSGWTASGNLNTETAKFGSSKNNVSTNAINSTSKKITTNYLINLTAMNKGSITLTATWTPRDDTKYTVKHWKQKLNGGTDENSTNYVLDETNNLEGTTMTKASSTVKTYTGFTSPSKKSPLIAADGSTVINYYYNRNEYTITISRNNTAYGTVSSSSVKLDYGNTYSVSGATLSFTNGTNVTAEATSATGYTTNFSSWSSTTGTITSDITITANFTRTAHKYTVKYDCNGGKGSTSDSSHTYDVEKKLTANGCSKDNYNFDGWNIEKDGSGDSYSDGANVKNLTSKNNHTITLHAQWKLADAENPKCTITVSSSGLTLNPTDDREVHSYDLTTSSSPSYNNNKTKSLSAKTFYGYVKDTVGKTGECSVTISNASASTYTCSKSAIKYSYPSCNTKAKYDNPKSACESGTTYSSNSCGRKTLWSADKSGCGEKYGYSGTCQCWYYPGGSKTSVSCTASSCSSTCSGYNYSSGTCEKVLTGYGWSGQGTEYGLESCTEKTFTCDKNHVGQIKVTNCRELTEYKYTGSVTCYSYYCNSDEGTKSGTNCYKYNQSSCASGWTSSVSSYKCDTGKTLITGTSYCKNN